LIIEKCHGRATPKVEGGFVEEEGGLDLEEVPWLFDVGGLLEVVVDDGLLLAELDGEDEDEDEDEGEDAEGEPPAFAARSSCFFFCCSSRLALFLAVIAAV
jgi:hypothetical protein